MYFTTGHPHYTVLANMPLQQLKYGWTEISGNFHAQNGKIKVKHYYPPPPFSNKKDRKYNSKVFNKKEGRLNNLQLEV